MKYIANLNTEELKIINELLEKTESNDIYELNSKVCKMLKEQSKDRLYCVWKTMRQRCNNPNSHDYKWYGALGINICKEWEDPKAFISWAKSSGYKKGLTIDRIDMNGNYEPNNCRWVTIGQQQKNKRNCVKLEYKGQVHTINEWADITGIHKNVIYYRYHRKWDTKRIFEQKPMPQGKYIRKKGGGLR